MNIILLSGGSGKRLWPLSNDIHSKQFLKIFKKPDGAYESMIQRMYRGISYVDTDAKITIATSMSQVQEVYDQLGGEVRLSVEPYRKDTFPAIALACSYLHDVRHVDKDEPVVVCPVDPYVEKDFFQALRQLSGLIDKANLTLLGITPTYPSAKYGYIIPNGDEDLSHVNGFTEKPDESTAEKYIKEGALWNAGVFAFKLGYVLDKAHELIGFGDYDDLYSKYSKLEKISFDYAVVEKETSVNVLRFHGIWKDMGTWNTLAESMDEDIIGKAIMDESCENTQIINELDVPILAMGIRDAVISAAEDGIIVTDKNRSSYIKPYVEKIEG